jgi:hypothetical protein
LHQVSCLVIMQRQAARVLMNVCMWQLKRQCHGDGPGGRERYRGASHGAGGTQLQGVGVWCMTLTRCSLEVCGRCLSGAALQQRLHVASAPAAVHVLAAPVLAVPVLAVHVLRLGCACAAPVLRLGCAWAALLPPRYAADPHLSAAGRSQRPGHAG